MYVSGSFQPEMNQNDFRIHIDGRSSVFSNDMVPVTFLAFYAAFVMFHKKRFKTKTEIHKQKQQQKEFIILL